MAKTSLQCLDTKVLIEECIQKLQKEQQAPTGNNYAYYPTVVFFLGEECAKHLRTVSETLAGNWRNARYLRYVNVYHKKGELTAKMAIPGESGYEWDSHEAKFDGLFYEAIQGTLAEGSKTFSTFDTVKLDFILDAAEEGNEEYLSLFFSLDWRFNVKKQQTLYLLMDVRPQMVVKTELLLKKAIQLREMHGGTIYLLSNQLDSGKFLLDSEIWENYRLIADIILLGGNQEGNDARQADGLGTDGRQSHDKLYGKVKTASYYCLTKPNKEITMVSLTELLGQLRDWGNSRVEKDYSSNYIRKKLNMDAQNGFAFAEKIFDDSLKNSIPWPSDLSCLPFVSKKGAKIYRKAIKSRSRSTDNYNAITKDAWEKFQEMHYDKMAEQFWDSEEQVTRVRNEIRQLLANAFSFFEWLRIGMDQTAHKNLMNAIVEEYRDGGQTKNKSHGRRDSWKDCLAHRAEFRCKKIFYAHVKRLMREEAEKLIKEVDRMNDKYEEIMQKIDNEYVALGRDTEDVKKYYKNEVAKMIIEENDPALFDSLFALGNDRECFYSILTRIFERLILRPPYKMDFMEEYSARMDNLTETQIKHQIHNLLRGYLTQSIRFRSLFGGARANGSNYYLINFSAKYADLLKEELGNDGNNTYVALNRKDSLEQVAVFDLINPDQINLIVMEGQQNANQSDRTG